MLPSVPLPPILKSPNREKGTLNVVISGVTLLITMTLDESPGNSLDDILNCGAWPNETRINAVASFSLNAMKTKYLYITPGCRGRQLYKRLLRTE